MEEKQSLKLRKYVRAMKFLRFCFEDNSDEDDITIQMVDYCLGSANLICQFLDAMEND